MSQSAGYHDNCVTNDLIYVQNKLKCLKSVVAKKLWKVFLYHFTNVFKSGKLSFQFHWDFKRHYHILLVVGSHRVGGASVICLV